MIEFVDFSKEVKQQINSFFALAAQNKGKIFRTNCHGDVLYSAYLNAFPEGTDPMFRERTEHDCSCCKSFIRNMGNIVFLDDRLSTHTIWDLAADKEELGYYSVVARALQGLIKSSEISSVFVSGEPKYGNDMNVDAEGVTWRHFEAIVPTIYHIKNLPTNFVGETTVNATAFERSLNEISLDAADAVLELINQNALYRGAEFLSTVQGLKRHKLTYDKASNKDRHVWYNSSASTRYRSTVIGTLLLDISEGKELDAAVNAFEAKVAPTNYKRTTALVTAKMIEQAQRKVEELGLEDSLHRRYATEADITVNDLLFVDRNVKPKLLGGVFDELTPTKSQGKTLSRISDISIEDFISNVVPSIHSMEVYLENRHSNNFVSLIAPKFIDSKRLFKWNNNFSWSYIGEVTDSIKERVKRAGGQVEGKLRVSLSWHNADDLDLSVIRKDHNGSSASKLYYAHRQVFGACLDVDMNAGANHNDKDPVENIIWDNQLAPGKYEVCVHNFSRRSHNNVGFELELEYEGNTYTYVSSKGLRDDQRETPITFEISGGKVQNVKGATNGAIGKEVWGGTY